MVVIEDEFVVSFDIFFAEKSESDCCRLTSKALGCIGALAPPFALR